MLDLLELKIDTLPGIGQTAVSYALKMYPKMARWREDADYDIDNNFAYPNYFLDVYGFAKNAEMENLLNSCSAIHFHGAISYQDVLKK